MGVPDSVWYLSKIKMKIIKCSGNEWGKNVSYGHNDGNVCVPSLY